MDHGTRQTRGEHFLLYLGLAHAVWLVGQIEMLIQAGP